MILYSIILTLQELTQQLEKSKGETKQRIEDVQLLQTHLASLAVLIFSFYFSSLYLLPILSFLLNETY